MAEKLGSIHLKARDAFALWCVVLTCMLPQQERNSWRRCWRRKKSVERCHLPDRTTLLHVCPLPRQNKMLPCSVRH